MPRERVEIIGQCPASPEAVWAIANDFCGQWHPAIADIHAERDARGSLIRAFTVHGENTLYREQLTWFSDSDRSLGYSHLEGISGVDHYDGSIIVSSHDAGGSLIKWAAEVDASDGARLSDICRGTKAIFEAGIAALSHKAQRHDATPARPPIFRPVTFEEMSFGKRPTLALTATPHQDGPLCLFLHGIGGGRGNWLPQLKAAGTVMRAAALDLRGYGDSTLGTSPSTVEDYCNDILHLREVLGADKLVLVGLSYGSWIATSFAMRHPELLAGLVLSGGCTGMSEASPEEQEAFRVSRQVPLDAGLAPADFAADVVKVLAGPGTSAEVRKQLCRSMAAMPAETYRDALMCFTNPPERFDFSRLTMPVLMMTGQHDRLATPSEIRGVARRIHEYAPLPDIRYETIWHAGHVCNVEQPEAYNRILLDFLGKLLK
ncbi:alpha/beta fold hydrolase [Rhizobium sp. WW_1]|jgi:pimeloyl-ACP methyl ester carboxylesterase|uniref:alpha/beta fold hydrolase n=1 Tax=Rhizobium sp. WW_1 TaxID=1907375 RepID=UPI000645D4F7|nr:alpha/beta fold hydrolase [Rhizobium sp. WW_1]RKD40519.1 pimeloyl-ACP methyl ester carboxylesterase [Rhizobium sp. WW_1]